MCAYWEVSGWRLPMLGSFFVTLLATLARAFIAHACGEGLRLVLEYVAPGVPPPVCIVVGMVRPGSKPRVRLWARS